VPYRVEAYLRLLARSVETMLSPFGYTEENVLQWLKGKAPRPTPAATARVDAVPKKRLLAPFTASAAPAS